MKKIILSLFLASIIFVSLVSAGIVFPGGDEDNDGIEDDADLCAGSEGIVNSDGCSVVQICSGNWKNHGKYVSCVAHAANDFVRLGLITSAEKGAIVSEAAQSDIGK